MRSSYTETRIDSNGVPVQITIIKDPNIDDVVIAEAKILAYGIGASNVDSSRRVGRDVRDLIIRFGVVR